MKPRILVFCDYYLPGIKAGGGIWAVHNLVERFADRYDFKIVAKNHDGRDDKTPYTEVTTDAWNTIGSAEVFYLSPKDITPTRLANIVREVSPAAVFLNSVFSRPTVMYLAARRSRLFRNIPTILATCGELADATLAIRSSKKQVYLSLAKAAGLYKDVIFRASFADESSEIQAIFGSEADIHIAPDLTPSVILPEFDAADKPPKEPGSLRLVFVSRLARKKNLPFLLEVLRDVPHGSIHLDLAGPGEEPEYLSECLRLSENLGGNISVTWHGPVDHRVALELMMQSHFFILPTKNENFGYVFIEALAAGCPLIISDQTVWRGLSEKNIGWDLPLDEKRVWDAAINEALEMTDVEFRRKSQAARDFALNWLSDPAIEEDSARLLRYAVEKSLAIA
jgi:glycosyltransferase involved in cell wall biosynthesis